MSKAVRIRDHLYAEIEALAKAERRSLISQLEVLLEQALNMREPETIEVQAFVADTPVGPKTRIPNPARNTSAPDQHFKPDFK